jgi:hypothetical protein
MKKNLVLMSEDTAFQDTKHRHILVNHKRGGWYLHAMEKVVETRRKTAKYTPDPRGHYYRETKWAIAQGVIQLSDGMAMLTVGGIDHRFVPDQTNEHACVPSVLVDEFLASVCCSGQAPVVEPVKAAVEKAPKAQIIPDEAKAEMRAASGLRSSAADNPRSAAYLNAKANVHEQRAAQIIAEAEGVRSFEAEHAEKARLAASIEADKRASISASQSATKSCSPRSSA